VTINNGFDAGFIAMSPAIGALVVAPICTTATLGNLALNSPHEFIAMRVAHCS
jgi:hypothetical protein